MTEWHEILLLAFVCQGAIAWLVYMADVKRAQARCKAIEDRIANVLSASHCEEPAPVYLSRSQETTLKECFRILDRVAGVNPQKAQNIINSLAKQAEGANRRVSNKDAH